MRGLVLIAIVFRFSLSASAAINFVQSGTGSNVGTATTSLSVAFPSSTTIGNLIAVYVAPGSAQPGPISITDTQGNSYIPAISTLTTGQCGTAQEFFYAANIPGGSDIITATITNPGGMALAIMEYSGVATTNPLDAQAGSSSGCPSSTSFSTSITTTNPNELIVAGANDALSGLSWSAGAGYTLRTGTTLGIAVADQVASTAGTYTPTFNLSAPANAITSAAAFKPAGDILCGQLNDRVTYLPPNWDTFTPPGTGQSYTDPVFGCRVKRLTNSSIDETAWDGKQLSFMHYYSTFTPMNTSDTMLFVLSDDGNWRIKDLNGNVVVPAANTPIFAGHPVWDAGNGSLFYFASYNSLYSGTVSGHNIQRTAVHTFTEYSGISSMDSADISQDGDHMALVGQNADNTMDVFVWSVSQQTKTSLYRTTCTIAGNVANSAQPGCLHKIQLTPDNLMMIEFTYDGPNPENGLRLWAGNTLVPIQNNTNHFDTGYDLAGNSVYVGMNNSYTLPNIVNPCVSTWGLDVRPLSSMIAGQSTSAADICLLDNPQYWHASYRGGASQPWLALSFFDARPEGPEFYSGDPKYQVPPTQSTWYLYEDEIMMAKIDASEIYRLAHARSRSSEDYWLQPRAALSRDGKYVIFTSSMAYPNGCPNNMHVPGECSDVYLIRVRQ